uniref:DNA polymerase delta catalytic subunit n=1 Tax=Rhizophora mucronata TaxID=61149 RepID=A0A2P2KVJ1_RHIMU
MYSSCHRLGSKYFTGSEDKNTHAIHGIPPLLKADPLQQNHCCLKLSTTSQYESHRRQCCIFWQKATSKQ